MQPFNLSPNGYAAALVVLSHNATPDRVPLQRNTCSVFGEDRHRLYVTFFMSNHTFDLLYFGDSLIFNLSLDDTSFSWSLVIMAGSIKLFQSVQNLYKTMGIFSPNPNQIFSSNPKKLFFLLSLTIILSSHFAYFFYKTTFKVDSGKSFSQSISILIALIDFLLSIWKMPGILQLIKMYDAFIKGSKSIILMKKKLLIC